MARVQYGSIVTEIKGKNQGHVFQGGNVGFVLRSKGYTKGLSSPARQRANTNLADNSREWRNLTDVQRAAWNALAPNWIFYNKFGVAYQGSGFQIFQSYNGNLINFNEVPVSVPLTPDSPPAPLVQSWSWDSLNPALYQRSGATDGNSFTNFYATAGYSAGRNSNNLRWSKIGYVQNCGTSPIGLASAYYSAFPEPAIGSKVSLKTIQYTDLFPYPYFETILTTTVLA